MPKQFSKFLRNAENKLELLDYLVKDWSTNEVHCKRLNGKELYFTIRDQAVCLSSNQAQIFLNWGASERKIPRCAALSLTLLSVQSTLLL